MASISLKYIVEELKATLGAKISLHENWKQAIPRSSKRWMISTGDVFLLFERDIVFSSEEKAFARLVINTFKSLNKQMSSRGVTHQYLQTSIMSSVLDISVARYIATSRSQFLNVYTLLQYFKKLSFERYEGEQVKTGMIVRKNNHVDERIDGGDRMECKGVPFANGIRLKESLLGDTAFFRYVDGVESFYCCDTNLNVHGYINVIDDNFDVFEKVSGIRVEELLRNVDGAQFYIGITSASDIEIYSSDSFRIIFRGGRWYFIDCVVLSNCLVEEPYVENVSPWRVFYSLSKIRKGAAALFVSEGNINTHDEILVGHVSKDEEMLSAVGKGIKESSIEKLFKTGELFRILTTDGMTFFAHDFRSLYDFSVIVDTSTGDVKSECEKEGGGGRTTAACAASKFGKAIKVSEDGPISVYYEGKMIYKIG